MANLLIIDIVRVSIC